MSMIIHDVKQGTSEWHALRDSHYTASEAAAMLGKGKYMTRDQLLHMKFTGVKEEVTPFQQKLFDKGHAAEAAIRPHVEALIGEELYPITGTEEIDNLPLLASFDGLTMDMQINFEHKLWNEKVVKDLKAGKLEEHYLIQFEQQMLLSGAEKTIFVVSDGTPDNMAYEWFEPNLEIRGEILAGWKQFNKDLSIYVPEYKTPEVIGSAATELPAIIYKMDGLSVTSNLEEYKSAAHELVEASKVPMETDQEFADAEKRIKAFKDAETNIDVVCSQVVEEIEDIAKFRKDMQQIRELIRQARLNSEKLVKSRKDEIRYGIITDGQLIIDQYIAELNDRFDESYIPGYDADLRRAIHGKKNLDSMRSAVNDAVSQAKISLAYMVERVELNLKTMDELAADHKSLFPDLKEIVIKQPDDFTNLVRSRISAHKEEAARAQEKPVEETSPERAPVAEEAPVQETQPASAPTASDINMISIIRKSLMDHGINVVMSSKIAKLIVNGEIEGVHVTDLQEIHSA